MNVAEEAGMDGEAVGMGGGEVGATDCGHGCAATSEYVGIDCTDGPGSEYEDAWHGIALCFGEEG